MCKTEKFNILGPKCIVSKGACAEGKIFYYQGDFHISGVTYNDSCENGASQVSTDTSKNIETKMSDAF